MNLEGYGHMILKLEGVRFEKIYFNLSSYVDQSYRLVRESNSIC